MNETKIFEEVYNDFFSKPLVESETVSTVEEEDTVDADNKYFDKIDTLRIDDDSCELLKKIVLYMKRYYNKEESNYITFNIKINTTDKETIDDILDILKFYSVKYNYIDKKVINEVSLYKLNKEETITELYENNGIISLSDLDALNMNDTNFIKKFFFLFMEELNKKKITIVSGKTASLKTFFENDIKLDRDYFMFNINESIPTIQEVYNDTLERLKDMNLDDNSSIELLDYITVSFPKSELDYSTYISNLCKYISFNKNIPKIEESKSIQDVFRELNELVGLQKVKKSLYELVDLITLKNKTQDDLKINDVNLHMVFLGNPGTGKTTVARMVASILYDLKYIKQNKLIEVSSKDLVAEYVGQTAVKTMNVVEKAMGGVLFVDEAYALASKNGDNTFNAECIATLIKAMEDYRDNLVVIFAGYTKEMQDFLDSNSGIVSRIGYTMEFEDYTNDELKQIFTGMVTKAGFILEDGAIDEVERLINENRETKNFGNARFVRNVFEKTVINHAANTKDNKRKKILKTITKKDIKYEV